MTCHVVVETTQVVAAPHTFVCVVIGYPRHSYIFWVSLKSVQWFWSNGGRNLHFPLLRQLGYWLFQQLVILYHGVVCTTVCVLPFNGTSRDNFTYLLRLFRSCLGNSVTTSTMSSSCVASV